MTDTSPIVCKPTPWFLFRAAVMLLMFSVFAYLFYHDGSTGYREKNRLYYLNRAFEQANQEFSSKLAEGDLTAESWREYAATRVVKVPSDPSVMPADFPKNMPWPDVLHDFEKMKPLQWNILWNEYTGKLGLDSKVSEEPYTKQEIREQWIVFWICLALAIVALFFLLRTVRRRVIASETSLTSQDGKTVSYADMNRLDLRKWDTKGLAFIDYDGPSGKGKLRIDGLTYGGFKKEQGEPAEELMRKVRSNFSGEIIEYVIDHPDEPKAENGEH